MKTCTQCSAMVNDNATRCTNCGASITPSPVVSSAAPPVSWQPIGSAATQLPRPLANPGIPASPPRQANPPNTARPVPPAPAVNPPQYQVPQYQAPPGQYAAYPSAPAAYAPAHAYPAAMNLKPLIPRTNTGIINRAEEARDRLYYWLDGYCKTRGIEPYILKSTPYSPSIWVQCRAWNPSNSSRMNTDRSVLLFTITTMPFHKYELLYQVSIGAGNYTKQLASVCELNQGELDRLMDVMLNGDTGKIKRVHLTRIRDFPWQFWRPKNKVMGLDEPFIQLPAALNLAGLVFLCLAGLFPFIALFGIGLMAAGMWIQYDRNRKRCEYENQGKPMQEPRTLHRLDSWQVLVFEIGKEVTNARQEIVNELRKGMNDGFIVESETIWYEGLDGKEEREQLVARFRRGIAFIQIYAYGQDLFVGWDAHINAGTWEEKEVAHGFKQGKLHSLRTVVASQMRYTEYDLFDTNCLVEWVHGASVKVIKRIMTHHKIDQEIDFKIIRGDRKLDTSAENADPSAKSKSKLRNPFKRVE